MTFEQPCPKTIRMMMNYYHRQLMAESENNKREVYKLLVRSLESQLAQAESIQSDELELIAH